MDVLWWTLTAVLMLAGLVGTVVPLAPGTLLIVAGAVLHRVAFGSLQSVGWITLGGLVLLMVLSHVVDFLSGAMGAKYFGATRRGIYGGIIGGIVGLFFGLPGLILGPLIGVLLGELASGRKLVHATKSTWGTFLGGAAGIVAKLAIALVMIGWFALALAV